MIGGIVSGITVFAFAVVGVLWHRSKKRRSKKIKSERRRPRPFSEEKALEPTPPIPRTISPIPGTISVITDHPPAYTEEDPNFGIQGN